MTKYMKVYAICLFVNKIHGLNSYKSIVNADGRPILRTGVDDSGASFQAEPVPDDKPSWLGELRSRIENLVTRYGYEAAKSHIQKAVEDTEMKESVLLDVKVERNGESAIMYEYKGKTPLRSFDEDDITNTPEDPANNKWVEDVEKFIVAVISTYSKDQVEPQLKPAINAIEKDKNMTISDIDVNLNDDGNVDVEIKQLEPKSRKPARKPHSSKSGSHKLRDYTSMSE